MGGRCTQLHSADVRSEGTSMTIQKGIEEVYMIRIISGPLVKDVVALWIYDPIDLLVRINRPIDSSEDSAKFGLIGS